MDALDGVVVVAAYLVGSIDFGVIVPRLFGVDIYSVGSGNPGASNVLRSLGRGPAAAVLIGDIAKGFGAAVAGDLVGGDALGFAAGLAAVAGHCFPVWHRMQGGKGMATALGVVLWLEPLLGVALGLAWGLVVGLSKRASLASLLAVLAVVPGLALFGHRGWSIIWALVMCGLVLLRHHGNIRRLVSGSERTIESTA